MVIYCNKACVGKVRGPEVLILGGPWTGVFSKQVNAKFTSNAMLPFISNVDAILCWLKASVSLIEQLTGFFSQTDFTASV